jgi:hypothetical protein
MHRPFPFGSGTGSRFRAASAFKNMKLDGVAPSGAPETPVLSVG